MTDETPITPEEPTIDPVAEETDDVVQDAPVTTEVTEDDEQPNDDPPGLDPKQIPVISISPESLVALYDAHRKALGDDEFTQRVYTAGTYENILHNILIGNQAEADRELAALNKMSAEDLAKLAPRLVDPVTKKVAMGARRIGGGTAEGDFTVSGDEAVAALLNMDGDGSFRIPLFNSGIAIDAMCPSNADLQNFLLSSMEHDRLVGTLIGGNYFAYSDLLVKQQTLDFCRKLITNTSMASWNKGDTLWSTMKLPDLNALEMWLAHLGAPEGYDGFVDICTAPRKADGTPSCTHQETLTVSLVDMIRTRWAMMSDEEVAFMVKTMQSSTKTTLDEVQKYQQSYGFDGMTIEHDDCVFTMKIPTVAEHLERGGEFIADITNEVAANNVMGAYGRINIRYMGILSSWVSAVKRTNGKRSVSTTDTKAIVKMMEMCDDRDNRAKRERDESLAGKIEAYINKVQLTWIGYPSTPCPSCGHIEDTPSGLKTVDPLSTFFTIVVARSSSTP